MKKVDFICGIIPAVITPMAEDEALDERGMETLIDHLIEAGVDGIFTVGTAGAIAASANIAPELSVGIFENFLWGDMNKALDFQQRLAPLRLAFRLGTFPAMLKAGAELLGLPAGPPRAPVGRLSAAQRQQLRDILVQMGKIEAGRREALVEFREPAGAALPV